jgi:prepilin-type N-terminal cleavage/methylation domain-containing protein
MNTRASNNDRGFSLIELMIVMVVIIVIAAAAMPNVLGISHNRPLVNATQQTLSMAQYTKNRSVNDFRAYGLQIASDDGVGGVLRVYRGTGPQCGSIDLTAEPSRVYDVNTEYRDPDGVGQSQIRIVETFPAAIELICFTPDGRVVDAATSQPVSSVLSAEYAAGEAVIVLQRIFDGQPAGIRHNVLVPYSGKARWTHGEDVHAGGGEGAAGSS